jgi:transposase
MDNASIHTSSEIKKAIEKTGATLVYLPPYSPDLSPIEKMWSKLKHYIKKMKPRTPEDFHNALYTALSELDVSDFDEWYTECGYMF